MGGAGTGYRARGDIWIGDLIWAVANTTVGTAAERRRWACELLGLPLAVAEALEVRGTGAPADTVTPDVVPSETELLRRSPEPASAAPRLGDRPIDYEIVSRQRNEGPSQQRAWLENAKPLPDVTDAQLAARPAPRPLFRPQMTRALLSTALATRRDEGDVDVERIVELACRLRPLVCLPRRPLSTLRFGIQLLIDRGTGMWPFHDDQERLLGEVMDVVGRDRVEVLYFADSPLRGCGPGDRRSWKSPYQPPAAGTPAVLLTDLGLARRRNPDVGAPQDEWLQFAKVLRGAECPALAILPYAPHRWPAALQRAFSMLPWDHSTSVSLVRRLIGHGLQVAGSA